MNLFTKSFTTIAGNRFRYHWVLGSIGPQQIVSIILRATGGLEKRQAERYASSKEFQAYVASTPVLVPGTRQYTWGKGNDDNKQGKK